MSENKRIVFRSGRQIGKTTVSAVKAIWHALEKDNRCVLILAPTQRQSSLMFRKVRAYCKHNVIISEILRESQTMISFKNGSEIHCLPGNNPDTIRGFSPTMLIIDEAAFVKDDVYVAAEPSLAATNGILIMISTPFGKRGRFYQAFNENVFEKYHIKSEDNPNITEEFLNGMKSSKTELEYLQEFEGEFLEEQDTYFSRELVFSAIEDLQEETLPQDHHNYYLGVDCARYGLDETVYTIAKINKAGDIRIVFIRATSKKPLTDIMGKVQELHKVFVFKGIFIDSSGLGGGAVDVLKMKGLPIKALNLEGQNPSDSVQFTLQNKEEMYKNLKLLMEQKRIKYPKNDKLVNQLSDLQYEFTENGHLKLHHPENGHDDYSDSLVLAVAFAVRPKQTPYWSV